MKTSKHIAGLLLGIASLSICPQTRAQEETAPPTTGAEAVEGERASAQPAQSVDDGRQTALVSKMILKVVNPREAREVLKEAAKTAGGHPVLVTDNEIRLKIPPKDLSAFLETAVAQGLVVEKSLEREDLTQEIAQLEGQLVSKIKILSKLRGFFDDSNVQATLKIEKNMTALVSEIESVKGRLRVLRDRARWAVVEVSFQFKQRDRIVYVHSPFEWLNSISLDRFLGDF